MSRMGWVRVRYKACGLGRVNRFHMKPIGLFLVRDEKENPRGAAIPSMILLVTIETQPTPGVR